MRVAPGEQHLARHARVRDRLRALSLDAAIVTSLPNIAYLTGLFASTAALMVGEDELRLFVDGRYLGPATARQSELPGLSVTLVRPAGSFEESIAEAAQGYRAGRIGVEGSHMTIRQHQHLVSLLVEQGGPQALEATDGLVENLRAVKDSWEISRLRDAAGRLSEAAKCIIPKALAGMRERDVAGAIEAELRRVGFDKPAFDTIVASGRTRRFRTIGAETASWRRATWWCWTSAACSMDMRWTFHGPSCSGRHRRGRRSF